MGFTMWQEIYRRHEGPEGDTPIDHSRRCAGTEALFQARESERDRSFLRRFLDEDLIRRLGLFEYGTRKGDYVVTEVADDQGWQNIKSTLIDSVGMAMIPMISVHDGDFEGNRHLYLEHDFDGRELNLENAEKTLAYAFTLWGRRVVLASMIGGKRTLLTYDEDGLSTQKPS